jgi:hypothetical protein
MSKQFFTSNAMRLLAAAACAVATASCGSELMRTGRAPVYLTITNMEVTNGASNETSSGGLRSDVQTLVERQIDGVTVRVPTIFNDTAVATIAVFGKDPTIETTPTNAVTLTRYRITFRRSDGRNTPGVDVPFGWDGGLGITIPAGETAGVAFEIVRHSTKSEPPLRNLINNGGVQFIYTVAEITFFGRDQNGNEVTVTGSVDIAFSDFGDPE